MSGGDRRSEAFLTTNEGRWTPGSLAYAHVSEHWRTRTPVRQRFARELAKAIRKDRALSLEYIRKLQAGEPVDELLLLAHRPLRIRIVRRYTTWRNDAYDLHQEARIAMIEALLRYDTLRADGCAPYTWLQIYIRSYLRRYLMECGQVVRRPVHQYAPRPLQSGFVQAIDLTPHTLLFSNLSRAYETADRPGNVAAFEETLVDEKTLAERELEQEQLRAAMPDVVWHLLRSVTPRERMVIHRRFLREKPESLEEIGHGNGLTRERIRQIQEAALMRMRWVASKRLGCPVNAFETFEVWCAAIVDRLGVGVTRRAA